MMKKRASNTPVKILLACIGLAVLNSSVAFADGMVEEDTRTQRRVVKQKTVREEPAYREPAPVQRTTYREERDEWKSRLSAGVPVWFFDHEGKGLPGAGAYVDAWKTSVPLNFRMGVEGRHMYLGQEAAESRSEWTGKTPRVTFIRIPFALEYMKALDNRTTLFAGGGPDILHTANDNSDTDVGMHLSARVHHAFNDHWGVALEAGYMWGKVEAEDTGRNIRLDNAFVTPQLAYTF
jgi:hypothetical protein